MFLNKYLCPLLRYATKEQRSAEKLVQNKKLTLQDAEGLVIFLLGFINIVHPPAACQRLADKEE